MDEAQKTITWQQDSLKKFETMISKIPLFHRDIAKGVALQKAELNAKARSSLTVQDEDIISAFLTEVPKAFYSLMIRLMDEVGFDYKKVEKQG